MVKFNCVVCGKKFNVKMEKIRSFLNLSRKYKILTDCFHSKFDMNWFDGWVYRYKNIKEPLDKNIIFKNKFYKTVGFSKLSREIYYFFWKLFHERKIVEYWECPKCCKDD